jgi:hypothetical protein
MRTMPDPDTIEGLPERSTGEPGRRPSRRTIGYWLAFGTALLSIVLYRAMTPQQPALPLSGADAPRGAVADAVGGGRGAVQAGRTVPSAALTSAATPATSIPHPDAPSVAIDRDSTVHAVWRETTDQSIAIVDRRLGAADQWTSSETLSDGFQVLGAPTALRRPDGAVCVTWPGFPIADGLTAMGVYARCAEGAKWTAPLLAEPTSLATRTLPRFDREGAIRVVEVGSPWPVSFGTSVLSDHGDIVHSASFEIDSGGAYHVVWQQRGGERRGQFHRMSADGGRTWSDPIRLDDERGPGDEVALLVADDLDGIHAAWFDGETVFYRAWTADGGWTPIEIVEGLSWTRAMVVDGDGRPSVFLGDLHGIFRTARADDGSWSPVDEVATSNGVEELAAAADGRGHAELLWTTTEDVPVVRALQVDDRPSV